MKLRKHLRNRRLTSIKQLGADRTIDIQFGHGETAFHLILEIYVSGNLILTDHEYQILALLRVHNNQETKVALRQVYPIEKATGLLKVPLSEFSDAIVDLLDLADARAENQEVKELELGDERAAKEKKKGESTFAKRSKKVQHSAMPVIALLHKLAPFADPVLCANCIARIYKSKGKPLQNPFKLSIDDMSFDELVELEQTAAELLLETLKSVSRPDDLGGGSMPELEFGESGLNEDDGPQDDEEEEDEALAVEEAPEVKEEASRVPAEAGAPIVAGWIVRKHVGSTEDTFANEEFCAVEPTVAKEELVVAFPSFHRCVDEFFTQLEENKAVELKAQHAQNVMARVDRIRADQGRRLQELEAEQQASERKASLIERNVELVDRALAMLNAMVASQVDWTEIWREVKRQQRMGHPIAEHIHSLNLEQNEFKLLLADADEEQEDEAEGTEDRPMEVVSLDLNLSAHANVARLHARRKETREKTSRTQTHAEAAIKSAERKAHQDMQKFDLKQTIRRVRQNWWFEKYIWFISSENYLVISGHDAMQSEQLFLKHVGPNDAFVQADVAGARTCFVRNPSGGEVPPGTLREAGTLALCHSSAWDKQIVISAWWVPLSQVTRGMPPEGDHHFIDDFYITGRRNFMPPLHLEMGMTVLFQVSEQSCQERHKGERKSRYLEAMAQQDEKEELVEIDADDKMNDDAADHDDKKEENQESDEDADQVDAEETEPKESTGHDAGEDQPDQPVDLPSQNGKVRLSKAERRRQRKDGEDGEELVRPVMEAPISEAKGGKAAKGPACAPLPRGQKSKAKKMKEKYADQDEEERELRLALLGSRVTKRAGGDGETPASGGTGGTDPLPESIQASTGATDDVDANKEAKGNAERKRQKPNKREGEVLKAGRDADGGSVDAQPFPQLDLLTGHPQPEDEVLCAIPMVAPYCSLGGPYHLRIKLTPGNQRKGQAARHCLKIFEEQTERRNWKLLVQAIPEQEATQLMCGSCKMSMPGLQKLQQQLRKEKLKESNKDREKPQAKAKQKPKAKK